MDLSGLYPWLRFGHILSALLFVAGHGVSMVVAFRIRAERDPARMLALLDLSASSLYVAGVGLLLVLVTGIAAGIVGNLFGRGWIWASIVVFVVVAGVMTPLAGAHFARLREGLGQRTRQMKPTDPDPTPLTIDNVLRVAGRRTPEATAAIGITGIVALVWLMGFKPF